MQIIVTWSNGLQSTVEVEAPVGVTALRTNFNPPPPAALHLQADGSWACYNQDRVLLGYCLPPKMLGRPVEGLTWAEACMDVAISHAIPYLDKDEWERDRLLRLANAEKFHFHGHATEEEAIECYQEFLRDFSEREPDWTRVRRTLGFTPPANL
jgi:hypothetical protein